MFDSNEIVLNECRNTPQYLAFCDCGYDLSESEDEEDATDVSIVDMILDPEYVVHEESPATVLITGTKGKKIFMVDDLVDACANQRICQSQTSEIAPILPSRGAPSTGQLKLFVDVYRMLPYLKKTDKVLVIGSASPGGGKAYYLLAGKVLQVDLYDPLEEGTVEYTYAGTLFRYFKEYWTKEVRDYDVVFQDAYSKEEGALFFPCFSARVWSIKCFSVERWAEAWEEEYHVYGQIHKTEKRLSNVKVLYQGYHHVGSCPACVEIGYFGGHLTSTQRAILSWAHGNVQCESAYNKDLNIFGGYLDFVVGRRVRQDSQYTRLVRPSNSPQGYVPEECCEIRVGDTGFFRRPREMCTATFKDMYGIPNLEKVVQVHPSCHDGLVFFMTAELIVLYDRAYRVFNWTDKEAVERVRSFVESLLTEIAMVATEDQSQVVLLRESEMVIMRADELMKELRNVILAFRRWRGIETVSFKRVKVLDKSPQGVVTEGQSALKIKPELSVEVTIAVNLVKSNKEQGGENDGKRGRDQKISEQDDFSLPRDPDMKESQETKKKKKKGKKKKRKSDIKEINSASVAHVQEVGQLPSGKECDGKQQKGGRAGNGGRGRGGGRGRLAPKI